MPDRLKSPLPIDAHLDELVQTLTTHNAVVVEAAPGAGKTTRVPVALLDSGLAGSKQILVSEPRRLAARLAATHIAHQRGQNPGGEIGYRVRFDEAVGPNTRVQFLTEGILVRQLLADAKLNHAQIVILDEFHERSLDSDMCLALIRRAQLGERGDLKLIVMSATLDAEPIAQFLDNCPRIRSEGRSWALEITHESKPDERPLEKRLASAVRSLLAKTPGDILAFLPGANEIRKATNALKSLRKAENFEVYPLHGGLSADLQARAIRTGPKRKVILSTNVAESSVTIDGVTAVIDSGLARIARTSPWSGFARLQIEKISQASAKQRAGRAGRTGPGHVIRLYGRGDLERRPNFTEPEIQRGDLCGALLLLAAQRITHPHSVNWLDPPPASSVKSAHELLRLLGALNSSLELTDIGRRMLNFPVHARLARLIVYGETEGIGRRAALAAAILSERPLRRGSLEVSSGRLPDVQRGPSDVLEAMDQFDQAKDSRFDPRTLRAQGIDFRVAQTVDQTHRQLLTKLGRMSDSQRLSDETLLKGILYAFPERVARRLKPQGHELVLCNGARARLADSSVVCDHSLFVAIDVDEREQGMHSKARVRIASAIEPEWLLDHFSEQLVETTTHCWNASKARVERVEKLSYGSVVLEEAAHPASPGPETTQVLLKAASARGLSSFASSAGLADLLIRWRLVWEMIPEIELPEPPKTTDEAIARACEHATSFEELENRNLGEFLLSKLSSAERSQLEQHAPKQITLAGGRQLSVNYEYDKPPWVQSRLQDFFGQGLAPKIAKGRVKLLVHLLAPNKRAVQVTSDLAGFWERHYPSLRKSLSRRYPKHDWPEDGRTATPPPPGRLKRSHRR